MDIYLIRHGETEGNREGYFRGRADFPLNETGIEQAKALAEELKATGIKIIYSSPLSRAFKTAEILAEATGAKVVVEEAFTNINLGPWEGKKKEEVKKKYPELFDIWVNYPEKLRLEGAETLQEVQHRSFEALKRIVKECFERNIERIAVVTHRAVLKPLIAAALEIKEPYFWKIQVETASYSILSHDGKRGFILKLLNQTKHLKSYVEEPY